MGSHQVFRWKMGLIIISIFIINIPYLFSQSSTFNAPPEIQRLESANLSQTSITITQHVVYRLIFDLSTIVNPPRISVMKMSGDGSRLVFATVGTEQVPHPKIYTIKTDGSELTQLFDYATLAARGHNRMYLDINHDGSKVIWTDGVGEIFIANSTGGGQRRLATTFIRKDGSTEGPNFTVWPRITADGRKVYWIHTGSNPDVAGGYCVNADGTGQTQLFSYRKLSADVFRKDGSEYNTNVAFDRGMEISDDGGKMVFFARIYAGDYGLMAYDGSLKKIFGWISGGEVPFALSRDGSRVLIATEGGTADSLILVRTSGGVNQVAYIFKNRDYGPIFGEMTADGASVLFHSAYRGPMFIDTRGYGRHDLLRTGRWLSVDDNVFYRAALGYSASLASNGRRFCFKTEPNAQPQKIWIADIEGPLDNSIPTVLQATFIPNWLLKNGSTRSAFKIDTNKRQIGISTVHVSSYWNGEWFSIVEDALRDDGASNGDVVANDGIFTHGWIGCYDPYPDPVIPLTITACLIAENHQIVSTFDMETLFIVKDTPAGSEPKITSIEPGTAIIDSIITIHGENFAIESYNNIVLVGNLRATVVAANIERNRLKVVVPHNLQKGTVTVTVTVAALTSNAYYLFIKTGLKEADIIPIEFGLAQNYPNPFNPETEITWQMPAAQHVSLTIYDLRGRLVTTLVDERKEVGNHTVRWNGRDDLNQPVASGIYFYRLQTERFCKSGKAILMK